ncbi:hypothetical protein SAMN02745116_02542 [Pilibacter termitis]|uniref:Uncharacterized protein n=1 Tax=Pilibacter termitis TaxID=263852 RepID=A0A1T4RCV5_9ENTE|nr:hypothetical protein [Pilibacter termitis]SKA13737.1 hypothetical protein SAMN02745116_02542 [Pilibacter termitis]
MSRKKKIAEDNMKKANTMYEYENIEIVEVDGVKRVWSKKEKKLLPMYKNG